MNKAVIISIHPEYLGKILSGTKVFEYRKIMPIHDVSHLALYCTTPIKKVVAIAEVVGRFVGSPSKIWTATGNGSGITRKFYRGYFSGCKLAGAFELGNVYKLSTPLELSMLTSCSVAPQSFCYLNVRDTKLILQQASPIPAVQPSLIFVGGIHGVGKTTICQKAFPPHGYRCMTASSLIVANGRENDKNKRVNDVSGNQAALVEQLAAEKNKHCRLLIDGHFTLINNQGKIESIDIGVFREIMPSLLILIKGEAKETARRLALRDDKKWSQKLITSFQEAEENHAWYVSKVLGIPLLVFDNRLGSSKLAKSVHLQGLG